VKRSTFLTKITHSFQMEQNSKISSLSMPSLAHTVPCLTRTVPKPFPLPYIQYLSLLEFCLAFPVYSRLNSSHGVPADEASCIDGRTEYFLRPNHVFRMFFGNISKNKKYFFMVVFAPPRRVFNTTFMKISKV